MLRKMRHAMADRDSIYRLGGLVELDDALQAASLRRLTPIRRQKRTRCRRKNADPGGR